MRWLMAPANEPSSSEPCFLVSASRTNRSAALAASSGERRPSLLVSAASRIRGPRNVPGPEPARATARTIRRTTTIRWSARSESGGGPIRRLIARPSAAASIDPSSRNLPRERTFRRPWRPLRARGYRRRWRRRSRGSEEQGTSPGQSQVAGRRDRRLPGLPLGFSVSRAASQSS